MARVVYRDENYQTFYVDVNDQQPEVTIGRNQGNMILIPAKSLSRYHAKIVYQNRHYFIIDLKSSNGTYVNNQRVNQQEIHPGDKLRFGEICVDFIDDNRGSNFGAGSAPQQSAAPGMAPPQRPAAPPSIPPGPMASPGMVPPSIPPQAGMPPSAPKMNPPKIQMFNPGLASSAGPDLRSVSMRPISSGGTYRPTMPNQPAFDDDMAKMAKQIASPSANMIDPSAAPVSFDPNSMGIRPQAPQRNLMTPSAPAATPYSGGPSTLDPSVAPASFNPNSMGMPPVAPRSNQAGMPENPKPNPFTPPPPAGMDPAAAPMTFNPNSMGMMPGAPSIGAVPTAGPASIPSNNGSIPSGKVPSVAGVTAPSLGMTSFQEGSDVAMPFAPAGVGFAPANITSPSGINASASPAGPEPDSPPDSEHVQKSEEPASPQLDLLNEIREEHTAVRSGFVEDSEPAPNALDAVNEVMQEFEDNSNDVPKDEDPKDDVPKDEEPKYDPEQSAFPGRRAPVNGRERLSGDSFSPAVSGISRRATRANAFGGRAQTVEPISSGSSTSSIPAVSASFARTGRAPAPGRGRISSHFSPKTPESSDNIGISDAPHADIPQDIPNESQVPSDVAVQDDAQSLITPDASDQADAVNMTKCEDFIPNELAEDESPIDDQMPDNEPDEVRLPDSAPEPVADDSDMPSDSDNHQELPEIPDTPDVQDVQETPDVQEMPDVQDIQQEPAPEQPDFCQNEPEAVSTPAISVNSVQAAAASNEEIESLRAQLKTAKDRLEDSEQMVEMLNAAMDELKEHHASKLAALQAQKDDEISALNIAHLQELTKLQDESDSTANDLQMQLNELQLKNDELQKRLDDMAKTNGDLEKFIPKWISRFDALIQYAKAMERAVDKIQLEIVEPKSFEYVRSMSDMIRFCADDLKKY